MFEHWAGPSVLFFLVLIVGWDLFLDLRYGPDATISRHLRRLNQRWVLCSYVFLIAMTGLFVHFFLCGPCGSE